MPYSSITGPGGALAATGLAAGQAWLAVVCAVLVVTGVALVRLTFRRGRGPVSR
ncbi:hypothetical protein AB0L74_21635 [Streptomyces sp. NPDC052020]|uniref:hypothetical protein n=1 Tax=Streptomyces sp. NPDC052020 TaxID=3155677 RepID=UPI00343D6DEE